MIRPRSLTLEDVRCFAGQQTGQVRRVTLLVGENGAGKSTFLGCYQAFARLGSFAALDDRNYFDDPPFRMGPFSTIAGGEARRFAIAGGFHDGCHESLRLEYRAGYPEPGPYPEEGSLAVRLPGAAEPFRVMRLGHGGDPDRWRVEGPGFRFDLDSADISYRQFSSWISRSVRHGLLPFLGNPSSFRRWKPEVSDEEWVHFAKMTEFLSRLPLPPESHLEVVSPDPGIPARRRHFSALPYPVDQTEYAEQAANLGRAMGLFSGVRASLPTLEETREVLVETPDGWQNLVDVGYGVHAVLSLLAAMCRAGDAAAFLLQEPELHLHPAAQAELATLMAKGKQHFLIETHSEHFVDRFRIEAMRGGMDPEDLQILYFEKAADGTGSKIHDIGVDGNGNLSGAPRGYRRFFLEEADRLFFARPGDSRPGES